MIVSEVARMLGVTRNCIHAYMNSGSYIPFKYLPTCSGKGKGIALFLKSEVLDIEEKKQFNMRKFKENYIRTDLAKNILKNFRASLIKDLDAGVIKQHSGINNHAVFVDLREFTEYCKRYGVVLDGLIPFTAIDFKLYNNGIFIKPYEFLTKYEIKAVYSYAHRYQDALYKSDEMDSAIQREVKSQNSK